MLHMSRLTVFPERLKLYVLLKDALKRWDVGGANCLYLLLHITFGEDGRREISVMTQKQIEIKKIYRVKTNSKSC